MLRRCLPRLQAAAASTAKKSTSRRTVVRDPRKLKQKQHQLVKTGESVPASHASNSNITPSTPFQSMAQQNQESIGSSLATYALLGVGVTMGITVVRLIIG